MSFRHHFTLHQAGVGDGDTLMLAHTVEARIFSSEFQEFALKGKPLRMLRKFDAGLVVGSDSTDFFPLLVKVG